MRLAGLVTLSLLLAAPLGCGEDASAPTPTEAPVAAAVEDGPPAPAEPTPAEPSLPPPAPIPAWPALPAPPPLPEEARVDPAGLPGVARPDRGLARALRASLDRGARGGAPRYVNRLARESSPFLRSRATSPVSFYPWGDEALARARAEGKPILLTIGYASCHYCHLMARESFDDPEVAAFLNRHYVAIAVDREARPDLDATYLRAVQLLGAPGGWPLTLLLTPDGVPFFGATYVPPDAATRSGEGFLSLLREMHAKWTDAPEELRALGADATRRLVAANRAVGRGEPPGTAPLERAAAELARSYDAVHGGFGGAPKFPRAPALAFLLREHRRTGDAPTLARVERTLDVMARSGLRDVIGGGFHRYAVDRAFRVPHFEVMLADSAALALVYLEAWQLTGRQELAEVAREVLADLHARLGAPDGGFHTSLDAESRDPGGRLVEGYYDTWSLEEVRAAVDAADLALARAAFGFDGEPTLGGRFVPTRLLGDEELARTLGLSGDEVVRGVARVREALQRARAPRAPPAVDAQVVAAFHGLALSAFARGALATGDAALRARALRAGTYALEALFDGEGRLRRVGGAEGEGYLEDHAFLACGLLDLWEVDPDPRWLRAARALHETLERDFSDPRSGAFFRTSARHETLYAREVPLEEGSLPSGNAVAAENLLRLAELAGDATLRARASRVLGAAAPMLRASPTAAPGMLAALAAFHDRGLAVVIVRPSAGDRDPLTSVVARTFVPGRVLATLTEDARAAQASAVPLLEAKVPREGRATAYVCERGRCSLPTTSPDELARQLTLAATPRPAAELLGAGEPPAPGTGAP